MHARSPRPSSRRAGPCPLLTLCLLAGAPAALAQDDPPPGEEGGARPRLSLTGALNRMNGHEGGEVNADGGGEGSGDADFVGPRQEDLGGAEDAVDEAARERDRLLREAATLSARGEHAEAAERLEQLLRGAPADAELNYRLSRELRLSAVDDKVDARRETDPARKKALNQRAHHSYMRSKEHLLRGQDFVLEEARRIERGERPGGPATAASLLGQLVTAHDDRERERGVAYDAASREPRQALADTYLRLAQARDGSRPQYREGARKQLSELRQHDPVAEVRRQARAQLHAMARETPQLVQGDFEAHLAANGEPGWTSRMCAPVSGAALAQAEGLRSPWTHADTRRVAFGATRGDGVWVRGGQGDQSGVAASLTDYFGYPTQATTGGTSALIREQIDEGRAVMIGGGRDAGPFDPSLVRGPDGAWKQTEHKKGYEADGHFMPLVGYQSPWEQGQDVQAVTRGKTSLYVVRDVDTGKEYGLTQQELDTFTGRDGSKYVTAHSDDPEVVARAEAANRANGR